jgi:antitoxin HigA-1
LNVAATNICVRDETASISADTAVLLAKFFGTTPEFWMNLQSAHELRMSAKKLAKEIAAIEPARKSA